MNRWRRGLRFALPAMLIVIAVWLISGCIFVPAFNRVSEGENLSKKVGPRDSHKLIRAGVATRDQVLSLLGAPYVSAPDQSEMAYTWEVINGFWVAPLCFAGTSQRGARVLVLRFDDAGLLQSFEFRKKDGHFMLISRGPKWDAAEQRHEALPPELRDLDPYWRAEHPESLPTTTPQP